MKHRVGLYLVGVAIAGFFLALPSLLATSPANADSPAILPTRTAPNQGTGGNGEDNGDTDVKSGALVGFVWDIFNEAHVSNIAVKANNIEVTTDKDGFFAFNNLPVGTYEVTLEIPEDGLPEYSSAQVRIIEDKIWHLDLSFASQPLPEPEPEPEAAEFVPVPAAITLAPKVSNAQNSGATASTVTVSQINYGAKSEAPKVAPISLVPRKASAPTNSALDACASSPITVYKGNSPAMAVSPSLVNHETGQEGCVKIDVTDMVDMGAFQGELHFDPDLVEIKSVTLGDFLGQVNRQVTLATDLDDKVGTVYLGAFSGGKAAAPNGGGTLVIVKFTTKGEGRSEIKLVNMLSTDHIGNDNVEGQLDISNGVIRSMACFGDLNTDKLVNIHDIQAVAGRADQPSLYQEQYDFNADGVIDSEDVNIITERWNQSCK